MANEMDENTFWYKIWTLITAVAIVLILTVGSYWIVDRYFQGHYVVVSPQTVQVTK